MAAGQIAELFGLPPVHAQEIGGAGHVDVEECAAHEEVGGFSGDILGQLGQALRGDDSGKSALAAPAHEIGHGAERELAGLIGHFACNGGSKELGLVDDDPHVFASSVAENVRLARPGASDDDVRDVLGRAALGKWVDGLPDGIHTHVGAGSREVSGGERARLAMARALLADAPVLVLDEPTAHLDAATARAVAAQMLGAAARPDRSVVWITHGTIGLEAMDRVVRLDATGAAGLSPALVGSASAG